MVMGLFPVIRIPLADCELKYITPIVPPPIVPVGVNPAILSEKIVVPVVDEVCKVNKNGDWWNG